MYKDITQIFATIEKVAFLVILPQNVIPGDFCHFFYYTLC